jgi:hypothetical protein
MVALLPPQAEKRVLVPNAGFLQEPTSSDRRVRIRPKEETASKHGREENTKNDSVQAQAPAQ